MKISEIITDKYKLRIPPTVYYDLLADVQEAEEKPCEDFKQKAGVVIEQLRADRDRLATTLDEIRTEIERQEKWLVSAGYNAYNIDIAFDSIRKAVERKVEE